MDNGYQAKQILVTGGAGFIGSNFVRYMLGNYPDVFIVNLDALTYAGSLENLEDLPNRNNYHFVHGDIVNKNLIDRVMREFEIDTIIHFAAESHVDRSITGPAPFIQTNVVGTFTLLEASRVFWLDEKKWAQDKCRFHNISTDEVYGSLGPEDPPFKETTPYAPNSPYSATKASADHMARAYHHTYGLPVTITNCSNNYGPFQHSEKFIPTVIRSCIENRPIPVYGDGSNIRDWLYVLDHCEAIDLVIRKGRVGETFNIGGRNEWRNLDIVHLICSLMDEHFPENAPHKKLVTFVKDRPGHDWRYSIDCTKIERELNWKPKETFNTGIRKTVEWYLSIWKP